MEDLYDPHAKQAKKKSFKEDYQEPVRDLTQYQKARNARKVPHTDHQSIPSNFDAASGPEFTDYENRRGSGKDKWGVEEEIIAKDTYIENVELADSLARESP